MLSWSITFLVIGLIAGLLGLSGIAGAATQIAWVLFVIFLVLFLVSLVMGRRSPPVWRLPVCRQTRESLCFRYASRESLCSSALADCLILPLLTSNLLTF